MKFVAFLSMFLLSTAQAQPFASWGVAFDHPGVRTYSDVKYLEVGGSGEWGLCAYKIGAGGWTDITGYKNQGFTASNSGFLEALFGVEPRADHFYISYKLGPALVTNTDALLGSPIQVGHEISLGIRDKRDVRVGIVMKHFSDAGLTSVNYGRNFMGLEIQL